MRPSYATLVYLHNRSATTVLRLITPLRATCDTYFRAPDCHPHRLRPNNLHLIIPPGFAVASVMGKQGTITSFFRPLSSSGKSSTSSKATPPTTKRPRPSTASSKNSESRLSRKPDEETPPKKLKRAVQKDLSDDSLVTDLNTSPSSTIKRDAATDTPKKASNISSRELAQELTTDDDQPGHESKNTSKRRVRRVVSDSDNEDDGDAEKDVNMISADSERKNRNNGTENGEKVQHHDVEGKKDEQAPNKRGTMKAKETTSKKMGKKPSKAAPVTRLSTPRTWKDGKPVPYKFLTDAFCKVEEISGRLEIQAILTELFRNIIASTPEDLVPSIYLCCNKLAPAHEGIELGIGESILIKALSQVSGRTAAVLKSMYKEKGDLGDVAAAAKTTQKTMFPPPPLTVRKVFQEFRSIAATTGKNTQDVKKAKILKLLVGASKSESKYISRAVLGKLRIHLADKTVIAALAAAIVVEELGIKTDILLTSDGKKKAKMTRREEDIEDAIKEASGVLSAVYSQLPVWDVIIPKLLELRKIDDRLLEACKLMPGIPVSPMLAKPTKAISEVLEKFAETSFTCEFKYDGERAQIHRLEDGGIKIYSRNAENLTPKYPDLISKIPAALKDSFKKASFIIDAEAVAYDFEKKKILPFQELQGRKRKDVNEAEITVKVCIFAFDLLFFNGESLIEKSLSDRRKTLQAGFNERDGEFMFAKGHDSKDPEQIEVLLNDSIKAGCEGLMVKALTGNSSTYEPANRSQNWLKVKKDYLEGCGDSLDLVPIGGYLGRGKRTGSYGAFLLACYDPDSEEFQSICKIGTGFSEEVLENFAKFFNDPGAERKSGNVKSYYKTPELKTLQPDVWFEPVQVWEVKCADLSVSPQHMAAIGHVDNEKGIALRFPRFIRVRDDKKPEEATTAEQVAEFYLRQSSVANNA